MPALPQRTNEPRFPGCIPSGRSAGCQIVELFAGIVLQHRGSTPESDFEIGHLAILVHAADRCVQLVHMARSALGGPLAFCAWLPAAVAVWLAWSAVDCALDAGLRPGVHVLDVAWHCARSSHPVRSSRSLIGSVCFFTHFLRAQGLTFPQKPSGAGVRELVSPGGLGLGSTGPFENSGAGHSATVAIAAPRREPQGQMPAPILPAGGGTSSNGVKLFSCGFGVPPS